MKRAVHAALLMAPITAAMLREFKELEDLELILELRIDLTERELELINERLDLLHKKHVMQHSSLKKRLRPR